MIWSEPVFQADRYRARFAYDGVGEHQLFAASWCATSFLLWSSTLLRPLAIASKQVLFSRSVYIRFGAVDLDRLLTGRTDGHPFVLHRSHLASVRAVRPVFEAVHFLARVAREGKEVQLSAFRVRAPRAQVRQLGRGDPTDQRVSVNHQILHGSLFFAGLLPRHSSMEVCCRDGWSGIAIDFEFLLGGVDAAWVETRTKVRIGLVCASVLPMIG